MKLYKRNSARHVVGALLIMGVSAPLAAKAAEIYVYADATYSGASRHYLGDVENLELEAFNDRLSSIRVVSGVWTICTDARFNGRCETISGDVENLDLTGLNDRISSLRVESSGSNESRNGGNDYRSDGSDSVGRPNGHDWLTFFDETDFNGRQVRVDGNSSTLGEFNFNDWASSLRIGGGRWEICEDGDYRGRCQTVDTDVANLASLSLNNAVSSVRLISASEYGAYSDGKSGSESHGDWWARDRNSRWDQWESNETYRADVFEDTDFRGDHHEFNGAIPNMTQSGFNDTISSFRLEGRWQVCEDVNFAGNCEVFRFDEENLVPSGWNDRISSMRPIGETGRQEIGLMLFEDANFGGDRERFFDSEPDLRSRGFNDTSSSLQIREGRWEVCVDVNYGGGCRQVEANQPNLTRMALNDSISSVRRLDSWRNGHQDQSGYNGHQGSAGHDGSYDFDHHDSREIIIYEHADFEGRSLSFTEGVSNLAQHNFNDLLSSYRIPNGTWELCEDANFQGRCWTVQNDEGNVGPLGFNDRISSIRSTDYSGHQLPTSVTAQIVVYQNTNYGGRGRTYTGNVTDLAPDGWNDMISSFRVSGPGQWEICEHSSFGGRCQIFDGDQPTLVTLNWNDRVSSLRYLP